MADIIGTVSVGGSIAGSVGASGGVSGTVSPGQGGGTILQPATDVRLGGIKVGTNLKITADGVLSVDTASTVEADNTRPVTSAAVNVEIGNIAALLGAL